MSSKAKASTHALKSEGVVTLDGKEYKIEFTMRGLAEAEEVSGLSLLALSQKQITSPSIKLVWAMFFGLAQKHNPKLTFDEVQDLITPLDVVQSWALMAEVYLSAFHRDTPKNA